MDYLVLLVPRLDFCENILFWFFIVFGSMQLLSSELQAGLLKRNYLYNLFTRYLFSMWYLLIVLGSSLGYVNCYCRDKMILV